MTRISVSDKCNLMTIRFDCNFSAKQFASVVSTVLGRSIRVLLGLELAEIADADENELSRVIHSCSANVQKYRSI